MLDQDYYEMMLLRLVGDAYAEKAELEQKKQATSLPKVPHM